MDLKRIGSYKVAFTWYCKIYNVNNIYFKTLMSTSNGGGSGDLTRFKGKQSWLLKVGINQNKPSFEAELKGRGGVKPRRPEGGLPPPPLFGGKGSPLHRRPPGKRKRAPLSYLASPTWAGPHLPSLWAFFPSSHAGSRIRERRPRPMGLGMMGAVEEAEKHMFGQGTGGSGSLLEHWEWGKSTP